MVGKALQEIKYYQKRSDQLVLPTAAFARVCREIADNVAKEASQLGGGASIYTTQGSKFVGRFTREAICVLQMAAEKHLSDYFFMGYLFIKIFTNL
jgi:histone H3/H4